MDSAAAPSTYNLECPISIKWIISEEKLAALKDSTTYDFLETELFNASNIPGVNYYLKINPNGDIEKHRGYVWIFLHLQLGNEKKVKTDVKFFVEFAGVKKQIRVDYDKSYGWGYKYCTTTELFDPVKKFIVDGKFTVKCDGILSVQRERSAADENGIKIDDWHLGHKMWKNNDKDFTIKVGENSIQVHECIIAAHSTVFKAMFPVFKAMCGPSKPTQINICDFSFKVVEAAFQLCYLCETSNILNLKEKMELLNFCNKYDISDLKIRCEAALIHEVSVSNVVQLANCSIISNANKLKERCAQLLIECINSKTSVADVAILDNDFTHQLISNALCKVTET